LVFDAGHRRGRGASRTGRGAGRAAGARTGSLESAEDDVFLLHGVSPFDGRTPGREGGAAHLHERRRRSDRTGAGSTRTAGRGRSAAPPADERQATEAWKSWRTTPSSFFLSDGIGISTCAVRQAP